MEKIKIGDYFLFFEKKRKTKNIRLRLNPSGNIILTCPWYCRKAKAISFAEENLEWIKKQTENKIPPIRFQHNDTLTILGTTYQICHNPKHKYGVLCQENLLIVGGDAEFIHRRITDFAKKELYVYIQEKAFQLAEKLNEKPHKITLRNTSTRWGSCSSRKDLNFCWKLVFAPRFVIDYIIAHEVSHLKEMNHSSAFWKTVALLESEHAEAQIWLRKNGKYLQAII